MSARIIRLPCKDEALFSKALTNGTLSVSPKKSFVIKSSYKCMKECLMFGACKTFSIDAKQKKCHLYDKNTTDPGVSIINKDRWVHYETSWKKKKVRSNILQIFFYEI